MSQIYKFGFGFTTADSYFEEEGFLIAENIEEAKKKAYNAAWGYDDTAKVNYLKQVDYIIL